MKIAKQLIRKAVETNTDFYKNKIPNIDMNQQVVKEVPLRIGEQKINNKKYFDRGTRKENSLNVRDKVYMK